MKLRKDVIEPPPKFESHDLKSGKLLSYDLDRAIRWITQYPSLQIKFSEIAFRRIDFLESSLWLNHSLPNTTKIQYKLELMRLESDEQPIWKNALHSKIQAAPRLISMSIRAWMHEPIDQ
jgi:hypothetical protein